MSTKTKTLLTKDFRLRPFKLSDVDKTYIGWLNDPDVIRYLEVRFSDRSQSALESWVADVIENEARHFFKIETQDDNTPIGTASLMINVHHQIAEYSYFIGDKEAWGTSAANQVQVALFDHAFRNLNLRKVFGGVYAPNSAAHFNYARMGFTREAVLRKHMIDDVVGPVDIYLYGLLSKEWDRRASNYDHLRAISD